MRIKLNKINLENFKCHKEFEAVFDGRNVLIRAENGVGKTAVYDGFLWLLFGKDSTDRSDFGLRPLDGDNHPIKGLVLAVEAELVINGTSHWLRKEQHESIVKGQIRGYMTKCKIDEVPKKVGEFQEWVSDIIPEEMFRMLTDMEYFNSKMNWPDRRKVLLDVAGQVSLPMGFDSLLARQKGRSIEDYEKVLKAEKVAHEKERKEINPRIDELQRGLDAYAQTHGDNENELELIVKREILQEKIAGLNKQRTELLGTERQRQTLFDKVNHLTCERSHRETIVKNQSGPLDDLITERAELENILAARAQKLVNLQNLIMQAKGAIESSQNQIAQSLQTLKMVKDEYNAIDSPDCSLCGQTWPAGKERPGLGDIEARGNMLKQSIENQKQKMTELQAAMNELLAEEVRLVAELKTAEAAKNKRIAEINEAIKNRPEPDPSQDAEWQRLTAEIEKVKAQIGEPVSVQLEKIEAEKGLDDELLRQMNECLNQADENAKKKKRIAELEAKEIDLAQKIAAIDGEFDEIGRFKTKQNKLIEAAVNGNFKHIEFKLFDFYLNEGYKPCCVALFNGVPYPDMSAGQKMFCGNDVINTLGDYYGVDVPRFLDHAESVTMPIEAESQVIRLYAQVGVKEFVVEVEAAKEAKVVA